MTTFDTTTGLRVLTPGESGWDAARQAFNLLIDQRPAMIAYAMFGGGAVMDESMAVAVQARMALVTGALAPYDAAGTSTSSRSRRMPRWASRPRATGGCRRRAGHMTRTSGSRRIIGSRS